MVRDRPAHPLAVNDCFPNEDRSALRRFARESHAPTWRIWDVGVVFPRSLRTIRYFGVSGIVKFGGNRLGVGRSEAEIAVSGRRFGYSLNISRHVRNVARSARIWLFTE